MTDAVRTVGPTTVYTRGDGQHSVVMLHGWPDTHVLWDAQVQALAPHFRCIRFCLPGFAPGAPRRAWSLDEVVSSIAEVVDAHSPDAPVTLLLHDWGCFYGYQYALRHPQRVQRIVAVDVGDAGSRAHRRSLDARALAYVAGYQLWLALAWFIGGPAPALGDRMTRFMARAVRCRSPQAAIGARMNYPYAVTWFGLRGGWRGRQALNLNCPVLFAYGTRKPFLFHSPDWAGQLAADPRCRVLPLRAGHWVMGDAPEEFNRAMLRWLGVQDSGVTKTVNTPV